MKSAAVVTKIFYWFSFLGHCVLWPWPLTFWPQNLISTSTNQIYLWICDQNLAKCASLVFEIWSSQGFWDHRLTHGQTHLTPPAVEVFGGGGIIKSDYSWRIKHVKNDDMKHTHKKPGSQHLTTGYTVSQMSTKLPRLYKYTTRASSEVSTFKTLTPACLDGLWPCVDVHSRGSGFLRRWSTLPVRHQPLLSVSLLCLP